MITTLRNKKYNLITEITNNFSVYYQGIQKLKQNENKILKIVLYNIFNLFKKSYLNFLILIPSIVYYFFIGIIKLFLRSFSILFVSPKIVKKYIYNKYIEVIIALHLYNLISLLNKRNALLKFSTKSIQRYKEKKAFKIRIFNYLVQRGVVFTKSGMNYFMRKLKRKKKIDVKLRKQSVLFTKHLYNYSLAENIFYKTENKITYNVLHFLSKIEFILSNITKIVNYFKTNEKLKNFRQLFNLLLDKFRNFSVMINNRSVLLNIFRNFDQTFQSLVIKRLFTFIFKRSKKRFIRNKLNLLILQLFLLAYLLFKIIVIFNLIFNQKLIYFISGKLELLFSIQGVVNEYSTYLKTK